MTKLYEPSLPKLMEAIAAEASGMKGIDRRNFLKGGIAAVAGLSSVQMIPKANASANLPPNLPEWQRHLGSGVVAKPYGEPSEFEDLQRRTVPWLTVDAASSISMTPLQDLEGIITPSGVVFERYHGGIPNVNPDQHRLIIHGLVERPLVLTMEDLKRFPSVSEIRFIECPANGGMEWRGAQMEALQFTHGMLACCEWTGVKLSTLLEEVGVRPEGKWILAEGADAAGMSRSIPLEKALDDTIIAWGQNGEALRPEQGYPLRMLNPGWEGNTSVEVAASPRDRRPTVAPPRRDLEVYRPDARRTFAPVHVGDGDQLCDHVPVPREPIEATRILGDPWSRVVGTRKDQGRGYFV